MVAKIAPNKMGAFEKFMLGLAERCQTKKVTLHFIVAGQLHPELAAGLARAGAAVHVLTEWDGWGFVQGYNRIAGRHHFDIISFQFCHELSVLAAMPFRLNSRIIWHQQSEIQPPRNFLTRHFSRLRLASCFFDGVCGVYQKAGEIICERSIAPGKIHTIYNGVDAVPISAEQAAKKRLELGLQPGDLMLFSASSLILRKNVTYMIREFAQALKTLPQLKLFIAGDGDQHDNLVRLVVDLKVVDRVFFLGRRNDVQELIAAADLCLLTSHSEALPFFCGETMAQGKTMLSTPVGGIPEVIEHEINGILIKPEPSVLSAQICRVLQDEALRRRLEGAAINSFRRKFSLEAMVDNYWHYYKLPPDR